MMLGEKPALISVATAISIYFHAPEAACWLVWLLQDGLGWVALLWAVTHAYVPSGTQDEGASAPRACASHGKSLEFKDKWNAQAHLHPLSALCPHSIGQNK